MSGLHFQPACELVADLRARRIGARELLEHYLARIERYNPALNAIVHTEIDRARRAADRADATLGAGSEDGALLGLPMTIKETFDWAGTPSTWGLPHLARNIAQRNALAVDRLERAGAVILGKTNVPAYLADWQSYNDVYGTTANPWDPARTPGGSSGGAAAALAAGLTALELGSDIGGSIRNPAHCCGVYGHKPTFGIVPMRGHALPGMMAPQDIEAAGPLARSAADLAAALAVIAGPDDVAARGWRLTLEPSRATTFDGLRIAVMATCPVAPVDDSVQSAIGALADFLSRRGTRISDTARPAIDPARARDVYVSLLRCATALRLTDDDHARSVALAADLDPDDRSYYAQMVRAHAMSHRDRLQLEEERQRMALAWAEFFADWDLLLCPAAMTIAPPHDHQGERWRRTFTINGREEPITDQLFWAGYPGCFYLPATVAPIALSAEGLPIGVQVVGPQFADLTCIGFAGLLEREYFRFVPPPGYD